MKVKLTLVQSTCLSEAIENSTCEPTDTLCVCTHKAIIPQASLCVEETCKVKDQLSTHPPSPTAIISHI